MSSIIMAIMKTLAPLGKWIMAALAILLYGYLCYCLGEKDTKIEYVTKEVEVVRYEKKEKIETMSKIIAKPNLNDNDIIRMYDAGEL